MTVDETIEYIEGMKRTAQKDSDKRAARCVEAMDSVLKLIDERRILQNRCYVCSGMGEMCVFCNMECATRRKASGKR